MRKIAFALIAAAGFAAIPAHAEPAATPEPTESPAPAPSPTPTPTPTPHGH